MMLMVRRGTERRSASNRIRAALAAPETGGAVRRALSVSCSHSSTFLLLRGMTRTVNSMKLPSERKCRLLQELRQNDEQKQGYNKRQIEEAYWRYQTTYGADKWIGNTRQKANKGETFINAKPRRESTDQHRQNNYSNSIFHQEAQNRNRRCKQ